jgi:chemotaxis protein CheD
MSRYFLHPGAVRFSTTPERVETILGSCVSITLRDPVSGLAAISHCVLPDSPDGIAPDERFRYCDTAIPAMLARFAESRVPAGRLEVKLFGGAEVLPGVDRPAVGPTVGELNSTRALAVLSSFGLTPRAQKIAGAVGLHLIFDTASGDVWVRPLAQEQYA